MFSKYKKMAILTIIAVFFVALDRLFKIYTLNYLNQPINIISDIFKLSFAKNYNIAFSLPLGGPILNIVIILIILILVYYSLKLVKKNEFTMAGYLTIIIFGAISNIVDRIKYGYVIDYFNLKYFTVFNMADMMIVGGTIGTIILLYFKKNKV